MSRRPNADGGFSRLDLRGKIRCMIGGEWKPRCDFSTRQLQKFDRSATTPANSSVSCKLHTSQSAREVQCEGPCGLWRPLEHFSRNTRTHSKYWCIDCTSWQLSVEPGMAPCAPPNSAADADQLALQLTKPPEVTVTKEEREDRIEQASLRIWIQDNPSEIGDYDGLETGTQVSVIDTASEVSVPTLLDDNINSVDGLPQALNAMNLSRIGRYDEPLATVASYDPGRHGIMSGVSRGRRDNTYTLSTDIETRSQDSLSKETIIADTATDTNQHTRYATTEARTSIPDTNHGVALVEQQPLTVAVTGPPPRQRSPGPSGWARPNQRKRNWAPPRYVLNGSGGDFFQFHYLQQDDSTQ